MTEERRREILSKEIITIRDIQEMFEKDGAMMNYTTASKIIRQIRKSGHDRLHITGLVHIQDYIDYFNLPNERYVVEPAHPTPRA